MKRTLFAVKIRASRVGHDLAWVALFLIVMAFMFALLCLVQYRICQHETPGRAFVACLRRTE